MTNEHYLEVAKECGAVIHSDGNIFFTNVTKLSAYTARICAEKDAEIARLNSALCGCEDTWRERFSTANADIAMKDEALKDIATYAHKTDEVVRWANEAISASSSTVAKWKAEKLLPLQRQVAMLSKDATRWRKLVALAWHCPASLETASHRGGRGLIIEYEGSGVNCWTIQLRDRTLSTFVDNQTVPIEDSTQAIAEAYDREHAAKTLEEAAKWFDSEEYVSSDKNGIDDYAENQLRRMAANLRASKQVKG